MTKKTDRRSEALQFLRERTNYENFRVIPYAEMADSLKRLREKCALLGNPDADFRVIHVAGTKGKGTVSTMIERLLRFGGYRTGLFTSPHLYRMEERFALNGVPCSEDDLTDTLFELRDRLGLGPDGADSGEMTFFEISLLAAFLLFQKKKVDWAVLETGLGGRFDATNICNPEITVFTSLGYDHCELLGDTLEKIAFEKAGIIKPGVPIISGVSAQRPETGNPAFSEAFRRTELTPEALSAAVEVIRRQAALNGAELIEIPPEADSDPILPQLAGRHQRINAQTARMTLRTLAERGRLHYDEEKSLPALETAALPARFETISSQPLMIIDGAHNRQSALALADTLEERYPKRSKTLIFATTYGKDAAGMFCALFPHFDAVYLTAYSGPRAERAENLLPIALSAAEKLPNGPAVMLLSDEERANLLEKIMADKEQNKLYCFTGSFYFASMIGKEVRNRGRE